MQHESAKVTTVNMAKGRLDVRRMRSVSKVSLEEVVYVVSCRRLLMLGGL